jgi:hypothetical protein
LVCFPDLTFFFISLIWNSFLDFHYTKKKKKS